MNLNYKFMIITIAILLVVAFIAPASCAMIDILRSDYSVSDLGNESATHTVFIRYSTDSEHYNVQLEDNGIASSASITAKIFGLIPVDTKILDSKNRIVIVHSKYLFIPLDYEFIDAVNGKEKHIHWNNSMIEPAYVKYQASINRIT